MPRPKPAQSHYGIELALLPVRQKRVAGREPFFTFDELKPLVRLAVRPECMRWTVGKADRGVFAELYSKYPDAVLDVMTLVRKTLAQWRAGKNQHALVMEFLRTHSACSLDDTPKRVSVAHCYDGELALALQTHYGFTFSIDSVKRARQEVAKLDKAISFFQRPSVDRHMRSGPAPARIKSRKGKK